MFNTSGTPLIFCLTVVLVVIAGCGPSSTVVEEPSGETPAVETNQEVDREATVTEPERTATGPSEKATESQPADTPSGSPGTTAETATDDSTASPVAVDQPDTEPLPGEQQATPGASDGSNKFALLVGCTVYPQLEERFHLVGPANDVVLAKKMLVERFQFPEQNVVTLADTAGGDDLMPTRANIEREWTALAEKAGQGDQVLVLMAGHGSQAPQLSDDEEDAEADGMDEMFLPRDVGPWNDTAGEVENGIRDDDIKQWIGSIRDKGANLCVIIDACHSGTMTRGAGDEVKRELTPEALGVPKGALEKAYAKAAQSGDEAEEETQLIAADEGEKTRAIGGAGGGGGPVLVAIYAAQSIEPTVEKKLPRRGANRQYYGLLTYTMSEILSQAESKLTYRELVQRVHRQYVKWGRMSPTPVIEGNGADREVLGLETFPDRPKILISGSRFSGYKVNAGTLTGLTAGSILAVYPPAGAADGNEVIGHVRILGDKLTPVEASIEPCEYDGVAAPEKLESGMRCNVVFNDLGDQRLRVCVDTHTDENEKVPDDVVAELRADLEDFADEHKHLTVAVEDPADADWLLRRNSLESDQLFLTPVSGWHGQKEGKLPPLFGPAPEGNERLGWLTESLSKIAKVQTLLRISGGAGAGWGDPEKMEVEIVRYKDSTDRKGEAVQFDRGGIKLYNKDRIGFRVKNTGDEPLDVTVLMVDSSYGIYALYPTPGQTNRLYPGNEIIKRGAITANTTGLEHLVVMAVKGKAVDAPMNFACLAQPSIERTRAVGGASLNSPLGKVFQQALYGAGEGEATRGFASKEVDTFHTQTLSWTTSPDERPGD